MNDEQQSLSELLALDLLSEEEARAVSADIAHAVFANVANRAATELSGRDLQELMALIEKNASAEDVHHFLRTHLHNFDEMVATETAKLLTTARNLRKNT